MKMSNEFTVCLHIVMTGCSFAEKVRLVYDASVLCGLLETQQNGFKDTKYISIRNNAEYIHGSFMEGFINSHQMFSVNLQLAGIKNTILDPGYKYEYFPCPNMPHNSFYKLPSILLVKCSYGI